MPRNMSFALTTEQIRNRTKTVTRRIGWQTLQPGEVFHAVEKCMGFKKGEKIKRLALLRCVRNQSVRLDTIDKLDCAREGFPHLSPDEFVGMFCESMRCNFWDTVQRIEFEYVEQAEPGNGE